MLVLMSEQFDMICLCETWLRNNETTIPGSIWYGQNRLTISKRAIRASGSVGILVRSKWATTFNITTLDSLFESVTAYGNECMK